MSYKTAVRPGGVVYIGSYEELGFEPGTVVEVSANRTGTLMIRIDDSIPLDLPRDRVHVLRKGLTRELAPIQSAGAGKYHRKRSG